jgi:hypothetical protein
MDNKPEQNVLFTLEITKNGKILCWSISDIEGNILEEHDKKDVDDKVSLSHTWIIPSSIAVGYVKDVIRFIEDEDWVEGERF